MKTITTTIYSSIGFVEDIRNVYNNGGISELGNLKLRYKFISYFNEEDEHIIEEYKNNLNNACSEVHMIIEDGHCDEIDCSLEIVGNYKNKINIYNLLKA